MNINAHSDEVSDLHPDLATDAGGGWLAAWQPITTDGNPLFKDFDILVARSSDNGGSWSNPAPPSPNQSNEEHDDTFPRVALTGHGRWLVVWESADDLGGTIGNDDDIFFALSDDDGVNWGPAQAINNSATGDTGEHLFPDIAGDGGQAWLVVWQSNGPVLGKTATKSGDPDIFMARSGNDGQTWSQASALNSNASGVRSSDRLPSIATNGTGRWIVVWESGATLDDTIGTDRDVLHAVSDDEGTSWTEARALNKNAATDGERHDFASRIRSDAKGKLGRRLAYRELYRGRARGGIREGRLDGRAPTTAAKPGPTRRF